MLVDAKDRCKKRKGRDDMKLFRGRNASTVVPAVHEIVEELADYLPMTVRQLYYQLVAREIIPNRHSEYRNISNVLTKMRRENLLSWDTIEDRSRRLIDKRGETDLEAHIAEYSEHLFRYYNRCLVQNQDRYVEIFTEKDALSSIVSEACWQYCVRVVVSRGQISTTFVREYSERAMAAIAKGQIPTILYIGDLDPSGLRIPSTIVETLSTYHGVSVDLQRIALTIEQIQEHNVPANPDAVKTQDPNYRWFRDQGFTVAAEVDALHPAVLRQTIQDALRRVLDLEDMEQQERIQDRERATLMRLKRMFTKDCAELGISYQPT
ncbi:MAG: hypothetical protein JEZ11_07125 [Desulfobacterales bacterium]|nr:hypothetical protein [Desulfobacterales bacterium]